MPKFRTPPIATTQSPDTPDSVTKLQRNVVGAFASLVGQVNASSFTDDPAPADLDMGGHKIQNVSTPSQDGDAVNLGYLKRSFKGGAQPLGGNGSGDAFYEIVYFNSSDITTGTAAQYNVGGGREGSPIEANISALSPPTGASIKVNFLLNGTTTVLATDLELTASTTTCVAAANINSGVVFGHNDIVMLLINQVGSTLAGSRVSIGLVVRRT